MQKLINLNDFFTRHHASIYLVEVTGNDMVKIGIYSNDILIVDRSLRVSYKDILINLVDKRFTAKQLLLGMNIILCAHKENYADIAVNGKLEMFEVMVSSIKRFKQ